MRSRAIFLAGALVVVTLLGGVTAGSVTAATSTTVTWKVSSMTPGQVKSLSDVASSNSPGVKTWSKEGGSCVLSLKSNPPKLTMGSTGSCTLKLKIKKSGNYPAKTSTTTIKRKTYRVGHVMPGGGIIFYVDLTRAAGSQYFEAACAGWSDGTCGGSDLDDPLIGWGCYGTPISGADGTLIGTGGQNTTDIVTGCSEARFAAKVADDLVLGGRSDWFLPSKDELSQMYVQRTAIGGFTTGYYWSSSEGVDYTAWFQYFSLGIQHNTNKLYKYYVRPVRAF